MKKILSISLLSAMILGFAACSKVNPNKNGSNHLGLTNPTEVTPPAAVNPLGDMPPDFTKKAVIEEATAVWCQYCPSGAYYMNKACTANPDKVYGVAYHKSDVFSDLYDTYTAKASAELSSEFNISGIPGGIVNRVSTFNSLGSWESDASNEIKKVATCGLGIVSKKVIENQFEIEVHAGFNASMSGDYRLVVYILEDEVHKGAAYNQNNFYDTDAASVFYGKGNPMPASNFKHNHAFRQSLVNGFHGDAIDAAKMKAGGEFVKTYTLDASSEWDLSKVHVLAMIVKKGAGATQHYVENAQECKLGEVKKWD